MVSQVRVELTKGQSASLIAQGQVTCMFTNQSIRLDFPSPIYLFRHWDKDVPLGLPKVRVLSFCHIIFYIHDKE